MMKLLLVLLFATVAAAKLAPLLRATEPIPGSYIIKLKDSFNVSILTDSPLLTALGGRVSRRYKKVFHGFAGKLTGAALNIIRGSGVVEYVEEDGVVKEAYSWGIDRVNQLSLNLDYNTNCTTGNQGVGAHVFVIDSGIDPENPQFGRRAKAAADFVTGGGTTGIDCHGHGTHCSGTVGGADYGVAPGTTILSVRVLNCYGHGAWSDFIAGCDFVADSSLPNKVGSMSIVGGYSQSVNHAVQRMIDADVATAVAAGNEDYDACISSPASSPNALTVGASDDTDTRASFSNWGPCVDIFAPGVGITSCTLNNNVESWDGTSMATPHVAGVMALLRVEYPNENAQQIMARVKDTAQTGLISDPLGSENKLLYCE